VEIAESKGKATLLHAGDSNALSLRIYTDGSGQNGRISAAAAGSHHRASLILGTAGDAQVFHGELTGIDLALHLISDRATPAQRGATAVICSDSQAALRFLAKGD